MSAPYRMTCPDCWTFMAPGHACPPPGAPERNVNRTELGRQHECLICLGADPPAGVPETRTIQMRCHCGRDVAFAGQWPMCAACHQVCNECRCPEVLQDAPGVATGAVAAKDAPSAIALARKVLSEINDWATMDPAAEPHGWIANETAAALRALEGK